MLSLVGVGRKEGGSIAPLSPPHMISPLNKIGTTSTVEQPILYVAFIGPLSRVSLSLRTSFLIVSFYSGKVLSKYEFQKLILLR
jgi:hypothetical protein